MSVEILSTAAKLYQKKQISKALGNDFEGDSRSSELPLFIGHIYVISGL